MPAEFLSALARFQVSIGQAVQPKEVESVLVYGGDRPEHRSAARVVPWNQVQNVNWAGGPKSWLRRRRTGSTPAS